MMPTTATALSLQALPDKMPAGRDAAMAAVADLIAALGHDPDRAELAHDSVRRTRFPKAGAA